MKTEQLSSNIAISSGQTRETAPSQGDPSKSASSSKSSSADSESEKSPHDDSFESKSETHRSKRSRPVPPPPEPVTPQDEARVKEAKQSLRAYLSQPMSEEMSQYVAAQRRSR